MTPERQLLSDLVKADPSNLLAIGALQARAEHLLHPRNPVRMVLDRYAEYHPRAVPDDKVLKKITARLKEGWSGEDLCLAIDGCHKSPFHCGDNRDGKKYQSLELIVRDSSKVQMFVEIATGEAEVEKAAAGATKRSIESANRALLGGG